MPPTQQPLTMDFIEENKNQKSSGNNNHFLQK